MSALTYPREWFRVIDWSTTPEPFTFVRETPRCLVLANGRQWKKQTTWCTWYPTLEEAQAAIDARDASRAKAEADKRIRDAAPELLEALELLVRKNGQFEQLTAADLSFARAAIAKATGAA